MARWISKITNAGLTLLARTPNNNFVFTKAECGSGTVNAAVLEAQTQVTNFKKSLLISGCTSTNNQVSLRVQLNNENVSTGFLLHQIGIYAKLATDSTDILFMILQTDLADFIPSVTESPNYVCDYVVNTVISNASSINANVDPAGYVTQGQLEEILAGLEDVELKDNVEQIKQEIGEANDAPSSSTTGTTISIFAKLNYLVSQISSYLYNIYVRLGGQNDTASSSTSSSAHAKLNWFLNLFGKTDDSGATATTGTAMGKLNKILSKSFETPTDTEFIKMCLNSTQALRFDHLNPTETELLNVNGKGYVGYINVFGNTTAGTGNTTIIKVYIDNELFFHFGISGSTTRKDIWFDGGIYPDNAWSGAIFNLKQYINGNLEGMRAGLSKLLKFETSLRVLASSTSSDNNNCVTITYGLEE